MAHNLRHVIKRGASYYYNRRVPERVAEGFGCNHVRANLGENSDHAARMAKALSERLDSIWNASRVSPIDIAKLVKSLEPRGLDLWTCADLYLGVRDINEKPVRLAVQTLIEVGGNRSVDSYTRAEARLTVENLLNKGNKTATVRRRLQSLHALLEFGFHELEVDRRNPFARLNIPGEGRDSLRRGVFTKEQLVAIYAEALATGRDTRLVLPILGETGARLAEVVGLRWQDVCLSDELIRIVPHPLRRLKTRGSEREVPLVGAALQAMRQLQNINGDGDYVFPRWIKPSRVVATHASNTLNKYLRSRAPGLTCHCFRHTMRDRLRDIGCSIELMDQIGGWSSSLGVGTRYGSGYGIDRRREALEAMQL